MIENGVGSQSFWLHCQPGQGGPPWTTDAFGIGMLLVHPATERGNQIVKLFLAAQYKLLR